MVNNNPAGHNGYDNGKVPSEKVLIEALRQYSRESLPLERRLVRLREELGYKIGMTKLVRIQKQYNIARVRKPPPREVAATLICEKIAEDLHHRQGPNTVKALLAIEGYQIPRSIVREVMHRNDPLGPRLRHPHSRKHIPRKVLTSSGPNHELSVDGHEKLGPLALDMGGVGFHIYAGRDKGSGKGMFAVVVANARRSAVVAHVYCDYAGYRLSIARQLTTDGGSETHDMKAIHTALRTTFAPDLDPAVWRPWVSLKSTHNISIENLWSRWLTFAGWNLQRTLLQGKTNGVFNSADPLDFNLFQWLWSRVIQNKLDEFLMFWNCHRVRGQRTKAMPSGGTPNDIFASPVSYGARKDLGVPVTLDVVERLRAELPITRKEAFRLVSDEFQYSADTVYATIGRPMLTMLNGWTVFGQMKYALRTMYA